MLNRGTVSFSTAREQKPTKISERNHHGTVTRKQVTNTLWAPSSIFHHFIVSRFFKNSWVKTNVIQLRRNRKKQNKTKTKQNKQTGRNQQKCRFENQLKTTNFSYEKTVNWMQFNKETNKMSPNWQSGNLRLYHKRKQRKSAQMWGKNQKGLQRSKKMQLSQI